MKQLRPVLISIAGFLAVASHLAGQASISGQVQLGKAKTGGAATPRWAGRSSTVVGPRPPQVAVVYLEGAFPPGTTSTSNVTPRMIQKNLQFAPCVIPVQKGTKVEFPNMDEEYHDVFSASKARSFELGRYLKSEKQAEVKFDKAGVVELSCTIHEHMGAVILVLDTPFFTQTDTNGNYRLEKLPPGKFTLKAWVDRKTVRSQAVELKDGETLQVNFSAQ